MRIQNAYGRGIDALVERLDVGIERCFIDDFADANDATRDGDAEFVEQPACDRSKGDAHRGFARARAFENVAHVGTIVFEAADSIGVTGSRNVDRAGGFAFTRLDRHDLEPLLVIAILDVQRDRTAERFTATHARMDLHVVGFDLHAIAAAIAHLAPNRIGVNVLDGQRQSRRHSVHDAR